MNPRLFKRLEDLLTRALDPSSAPNEREIALTEALRVVKAARAGKPEDEWSFCTVMRYYTCSVCGEEIKPAERAWLANMPERHRHNRCHKEISP